MLSSVSNSCPCFGHTEVIKCGTRLLKFGSKQRYFCKSCKKKFSEPTSRKDISEKDLIEYLRETRLDTLTSRLGIPRSTLHYKITKQLSSLPFSLELSRQIRSLHGWGGILGMDMTGLTVKGKHYHYYEAVDMPSGDPIHYGVYEDKNKETVIAFFRQIRDVLDYHPRLLINDRADEIVEAGRCVYAGVMMQADLFHLQLDLDKYLPTKKMETKLTRAVIHNRIDLKKLVMRIATAKNNVERERLLNTLDEQTLKYAVDDDSVKIVVNNFRNSLHLYHTLDVMERIGVDRRNMYNNFAESHMRLVKNMVWKMRGFRDLENARRYINAMWYYWRIRRINASDANVVRPLPLDLYLGANIAQLASEYSIPRERLERAAGDGRLSIVGDYAFSPEQLVEIFRKVLSVNKSADHPLHEISALLGLDLETTLLVLQGLGVDLEWRTLSLRDVIIKSPLKQNKSAKASDQALINQTLDMAYDGDCPDNSARGLSDMGKEMQK